MSRTKTSIYGYGSPFDQAVDLAAAYGGMTVRGVYPHEAYARLEMHARYAEEVRETQAESVVRYNERAGYTLVNNQGQRVSVRDLSSATASLGQTFSPLVYDEMNWVTAIKAGSVAASLVPTAPLMAGVSEVVLPAVGAAESQVSNDPQGMAGENMQPTDTIMSTTFQTVPVRAYAGVSLITQQLLDRSPSISQALAQDATEGFAEQLDSDYFTGDGANGTGGSYLTATSSEY